MRFFTLLFSAFAAASQIDLACTVWGEKGTYDLRTLAKA